MLDHCNAYKYFSQLQYYFSDIKDIQCYLPEMTQLRSMTLASGDPKLKLESLKHEFKKLTSLKLLAFDDIMLSNYTALKTLSQLFMHLPLTYLRIKGINIWNNYAKREVKSK